MSKSRAASKSLREGAIQERRQIEQDKENYRRHIETLETQNRDAFGKAEEKALEADGDQEQADQLREVLSNLLRNLETEMKAAGAVTE